MGYCPEGIRQGLHCAAPEGGVKSKRHEHRWVGGCRDVRRLSTGVIMGDLRWAGPGDGPRTFLLL